MNMLITGGTGFIGHALANRLCREGHAVTVLTRRPAATLAQLHPGIKRIQTLPECGPVDAVVNLAGENLGSQRWSAKRKAQLRASRLDTTQALGTWLAAQARPPRVVISGSAIGWYGDRGDQILTETSRPGPDGDFATQLCQDWEQAASAISTLGSRLCILRIAVVLAARGPAGGGALAKMLPPFYFGLGGPLGSGRQWFSWIHRDDLIRLILFLLKNEQASGVFNACAPLPVQNQEMARTLGEHLHRPARLRMPAAALRLLLGEQAQIILGSQRVLPARASDLGFRFLYPDLRKALSQSLR